MCRWGFVCVGHIITAVWSVYMCKLARTDCLWGYVGILQFFLGSDQIISLSDTFYVKDFVLTQELIVDDHAVNCYF